MNELDNAMDVLDTLEKKKNGDTFEAIDKRSNKIYIGMVEQFFDKINVVAIKLEGTLKIGDIIEIGTEEEAIRQRVSSMQIDRQNIETAYEGDSVGIKLRYKVDEGSNVYRVNIE